MIEKPRSYKFTNANMNANTNTSTNTNTTTNNTNDDNNYDYTYQIISHLWAPQAPRRVQRHVLQHVRGKHHVWGSRGTLGIPREIRGPLEGYAKASRMCTRLSRGRRGAGGACVCHKLRYIANKLVSKGGEQFLRGLDMVLRKRSRDHPTDGVSTHLNIEEERNAIARASVPAWSPCRCARGCRAPQGRSSWPEGSSAAARGGAGCEGAAGAAGAQLLTVSSDRDSRTSRLEESINSRPCKTCNATKGKVHSGNSYNKRGFVC